MSKEIRYQELGKRFLETQTQAYGGSAIDIYTEEFSTEFDSVLQECSPLIPGTLSSSSAYDLLKTRHQIVGLKEKILEFNKDSIESFLKKHKLNYQVNDIVELMFNDFKQHFFKSTSEADLYTLIFAKPETAPAEFRREIQVKGVRETLAYNVIYYEGVDFKSKNAFYTIRERRIPLVHNNHTRSERPDFVHYINGIPLVIIEYKTEDSGLLESLKDFEFKESYRFAPFKLALNDGRDVILFSDFQALKFEGRRDTSFKWVHYHPAKKYVVEREYTNVEYLYDELLCQPKNLYRYCVDGCTVVSSGATRSLVNARIQQYYALKDARASLERVVAGSLLVPYNYEFAHAQRSGKTITMKFIAYMVERSFKEVFDTVFIYVPDLQIKAVISQEFSKSGNDQVSIEIIETRAAYKAAVDMLVEEEKQNVIPTILRIFVVNMQKITDDDLFLKQRVNSKRILNIIDEAHHGQTRKTAVNRDQVFPNASNYLFTATGKSEMYAYYFPDNKAEGFRNKFTISDAKKCKITVPVMYLKADKTFNISETVSTFSHEVEKRLAIGQLEAALVYDIQDADPDTYVNSSNPKVSKTIKSMLAAETYPEKIKHIATFMDKIKEGLPFKPKAIVYVDSVEAARKYIAEIQTHDKTNNYLGYRWGVDFAAVQDECNQLNPGIALSSDISANFERTRSGEADKDKLIIDILFAVDKYQKGFDLPTLLATFLDTKINEPARMNQIYTRTATKYPGKNIGYCVDLSMDSTNQFTYQQSLVLYDNPEDIGDCFIDDRLMTSLKQELAQQFSELREALKLTVSNFTSGMILQQVLNEKDVKVRQQRQYKFFYTTKTIISNLAKIGSPLFFKPFMSEIKAITDAFTQFKLIYADKSHPEHKKILINTDSSFVNDVYITDSEIRTIINEVLAFVNENNIKSMLEFNYKDTHKDISSVAGDELIARFNQELKKNTVETTSSDLEGYLKRYHHDLYLLIKDMLEQMADDRNLIYADFVQSKLDQIDKQLERVKSEIDIKIKEQFEGNAFLFWSTQTISDILQAYNMSNPEFAYFVGKQVYSVLDIILPQIDTGLSVLSKVKMSAEMYKDKTDAKTLSFYLSDYRHTHGLSDEFKTQIQAAPKSDSGELFFVRKDLFDQYLNTSLKQYFQHIKRV